MVRDFGENLRLQPISCSCLSRISHELDTNGTSTGPFVCMLCDIIVLLF